MSVWDRYAQCYDVVLEKVFFYRELHQEIIGRIKGCHTILDVGTGTGNLLFHAKNEQKYGIDNNGSMLRYASKKIPGAALSRQESENIAFKESVFDAVVCINALYTSSNPLRVLRGMYKVLKLGGLLFLSGPLPNPDFELLKRRALESISNEDISDHLRVVEECSREILATCIKNSFTAQELELILLNDIGFSKIVESNEYHYLGQNYFVEAQK